MQLLLLIKLVYLCSTALGCKRDVVAGGEQGNELAVGSSLQLQCCPAVFLETTMITFKQWILPLLPPTPPLLFRSASSINDIDCFHRSYRALALVSYEYGKFHWTENDWAVWTAEERELTQQTLDLTGASPVEPALERPWQSPSHYPGCT